MNANHPVHRVDGERKFGRGENVLSNMTGRDAKQAELISHLSSFYTTPPSAEGVGNVVKDTNFWRGAMSGQGRLQLKSDYEIIRKTI